MQRLTLILLLLLLTGLSGCAYGGYGIIDDQRLVDTISDDKAMATKIKTGLMMKASPGAGLLLCTVFTAMCFLWARSRRTCRARP